MSVIKNSPNIALFFAVLAIATAAILVFDLPKIVDYVFAVFWFVTGLLAVYSAIKK